MMYRDRTYAILHIAAVSRLERCKSDFQSHPNLKTLRKYREAQQREEVFHNLAAVAYNTPEKMCGNYRLRHRR